MLRSEKEAELASLKNRFGQSAAAILVEYRGLKVKELTELRRKLTDSGVHFKVVKNRLSKIAISGTPVEAISPLLVGPVAVATVERDPVALAKILREFTKDNEKCKVKGGFLKPDKLLSVAEVDALAFVASKEESIAKLLGSMQAPIRNFVGAMAAIPRQLVTVLNAIKEKKTN